MGQSKVLPEGYRTELTFSKIDISSFPKPLAATTASSLNPSPDDPLRMVRLNLG